MKAQKLMIHWHVDETDIGKGGISAIFSADFHPNGSRLTTGGQDCNVRIWRLSNNGSQVQYLATLKKHTQTVNVVRFSPSGEYLASAGDDGLVFIWQLDSESETASKKQRQPEFGQTSNDMDDDVESWSIKKSFSAGTKEIYDLAWSPDSAKLVVGSLENVARVFDLATGNMSLLKGQDHYVQGVAWDPLNQYLASQSADRSICFYNTGTYTALPKITKRELPPTNSLQHLYHSESLRSFFRRLCFSNDGSLLLTPAGILKPSTSPDVTPLNVVYIYTRAGFASGTPAACFEGLDSPALIISCCPKAFDRPSSLFALNYTMIFAVATSDTLLFYSTDQQTPLGIVKNMHYLPITDLAWDPDASKLLVTSMDGICSIVTFDTESDLGTPLQVFPLQTTQPPNLQPQLQSLQPQQQPLQLQPVQPQPVQLQPVQLQPVQLQSPQNDLEITAVTKKVKRRIQPTLIQLTQGSSNK